MSKTKYVVKFTTQFKKDFKLAMKRGFKMDLLEDVIALLAMGGSSARLVARIPHTALRQHQRRKHHNKGK